MFDIPESLCSLFSSSKAAIDRLVFFASSRILISPSGAGGTPIGSSGQ